MRRTSSTSSAGPGELRTVDGLGSLDNIAEYGAFTRRSQRCSGGHVRPRWLAELDRTAPVDRAVEVSTVFRDADELLVGVTVPGGHP